MIHLIKLLLPSFLHSLLQKHRTKCRTKCRTKHWMLPTLYACSVFATTSLATSLLAQEPQVVFTRAYGSNERLPPVVVMQTAASPFGDNPFGTPPSADAERFALGSQTATIEFELRAEVAPNLVLLLVHCDAFWREDAHPLLSDPTLMRTTLVDVQMLPPFARYATHRARVSLPNQQVQFRFSGNWKAKLFQTNNLRQPLAEARIFVVEPLVSGRMDIFPEVYFPKTRNTGNTAYALEYSLQAPPPLLDSQFETVVVYRNHRWNEPFTITSDASHTVTAPPAFRTHYTTSVFGMASAQKRFRIQTLPAQNEYRVLELRNNAWYPDVGIPTRFPTPDLRRTANAAYQADDGAMLVYEGMPGGTPQGDDYVAVEFVLDPLPFPSRLEVYAVGTFNNWRASPAWKMTYNEQQRLYTLRQWVRRARHNYLYASGNPDAATSADDAFTFEEFEGNSLGATNTFIAFCYYRDLAYGGYDRIVGVAARNPARR